MSKGAVAMSGPKRCIDGSITTACIAGGHDHSWLSLQLAPGTRVGAVTVVGSRTTWAGSNHGKFAVWVGDKEAARQPPAVQCGKRLHLKCSDLSKGYLLKGNFICIGCLCKGLATKDCC